MLWYRMEQKIEIGKENFASRIRRFGKKAEIVSQASLRNMQSRLLGDEEESTNTFLASIQRFLEVSSIESSFLCYLHCLCKER